MVDNSVKIVKKNKVKGTNGYKTFSIRVKEEIVTVLDELAKKSNRSRNELICLILGNVVNKVEIVD